MDNIELSLNTLSGDVRDALLTHLRELPEVWAKLPEVKQQEKIDAVENMASDLVRRAVALVAASGFDTLPVKLLDFGVKGGTIKGKFESRALADHVLKLADHENVGAVLVLADVSDYLGQRAPAKPDPDEPTMFAEEPNAVEEEGEADDELGDIPDGFDRRGEAQTAAS